MKKLKQLSFIGLAIFILASCSVEKRRYMSGYYLSHNHTSKSVKSNTNNEELIVKNTTRNKAGSTVPVQQVEAISANENNIVASAGKSITVKAVPVLGQHKTKMQASVQVVETKTFVKAAKKAVAQKGDSGGIPVWLYIVLAIIIPPIAVGLATDWGIETLWNLLWTVLCGLPGIIHAFIILKRKSII